MLSRSLRAASKPLHHGLIGAVARHGQESSADQAGPERIAARQAEGEIENTQLAARRRGRLRHLRPAPGILCSSRKNAATEPVMYSANWITSVQITARIPPSKV